MRRFFVENLTSPLVQVEGREAEHILRVLRMRPGDLLVLFDGSGQEYICCIEDTQPNGLTARVVEEYEAKREPDISITLYCALLRRGNTELVVQKATELGVHRIVPVLAKRCVKRPADSENLIKKLSRIATEAAKQCGRTHIPEVLPPSSLQALPLYDHELFLVAYEKEKRPLRAVLTGAEAADIGLLIGPEGGFEEREVAFLTEKGAQPCSLGGLVLRAETAAIAALSMMIYEQMEMV